MVEVLEETPLPPVCADIDTSDHMALQPKKVLAVEAPQTPRAGTTQATTLSSTRSWLMACKNPQPLPQNTIKAKLTLSEPALLWFRASQSRTVWSLLFDRK